MKFCWTLEGLGKSEFKELISLHTKKLDYIFDGMLYKQLDHVYPLGPTMTDQKKPFADVFQNTCSGLQSY